MTESLIRARGLGHRYGEPGRAGGSGREVLKNLDFEVAAGEIVLLTGPSGSGKTTLLTLVGALRAVQTGTLEVLGHQLAGANSATRVTLRRGIGYIFQAHNLIASLTAVENVMVPLALDHSLKPTDRRERAVAMLDAVELDEHLDAFPARLSGGQRQRVAIARALVTNPRLILADEPTASLDRTTGRSIAELLRACAQRQRATVLLVTHDHRILDIADRVLHLEDGELSSYAAAVAANTEHLLTSLGRTYRSGELSAQLEQLPASRFGPFLAELTEEARNFLDVIQLAESDTFEHMLRQVLDGLTQRIGSLLGAERATLFLVEPQRGEMWSLYAGGGDDAAPLRLVVQLGKGIAGKVAVSGQPRSVPDAYADPDFDPSYDRRSGFHTRNILCLPITNREGRVLAVAQLLNKRDGAFSEEDESELADLAPALGPILESWLEMASRRTTGQLR